MPASTRSKLTWANATELVGVQLQLEASQTSMLYQRYRVGLHAWFLEQVQQSNPELSQYLHDGGSEKPFALGNLEGCLMPVKDQFQIQAENAYSWSIYALSKPVVQWMASWLTQLPDQIKFRDAALQIKQVKLAQPPTSYKNLLRSQPSKVAIVQLQFLSPTSFRSKGHTLPFPFPRNLFHSYLRRWNDFSAMPYDMEPFLDWIENTIHIHTYQLTAVRVTVAKQGFLTGFTGTLTLELKQAEKEPEATQLLYALLRLAPYCGTGYKTTFSLGKTSVTFLSSPPNPFPSIDQTVNSSPPLTLQPVSSTTESISSIQAIDTLTQKLIARRKRQGGTRSLTAARTEAEILIRHQAGEPLTAIAQKIGKSYDAVKKAYTRAKQALQTLDIDMG
jgi:CRISPR-associated endoribonuclease Cas6